MGRLSVFQRSTRTSLSEYTQIHGEDLSQVCNNHALARMPATESALETNRGDCPGLRFLARMCGFGKLSLKFPHSGSISSSIV